MRRYLSLFSFFFLIIQHVSCQLPSAQLTTMKSLHELLKSNNTNSKWNSSQDLETPCSWPGVSCSNSSITSLTLSSFSISNAQDSLASLVCGIETLQSLDLSNNIMTSIPQNFISSCGGLKYLNFSQNRLSGPLPVFQGFGSLEVLDLSHNMFNDASIDLQFDGLNQLKSLNISYNQFGGLIPTKLGNSMLLQELQLSVNHFNGSIPDEITKYVNLSVLDLSGNKLTGRIPFGIGELSKLQLLLLSANQLFDEIPQSISRIATLQRFAANQNGFTGPIPLGITRYLRNLDLSYNQLTGSIPTDLLVQPNLQAVDLSSNKLEGSIPSNVSRTLFRLRLGNNSLSGQIPTWFSGDEQPSLAYLEINDNNLRGMIPPELRLCKNLSLLDLSHNHLVGSVPRELGNLSRLQVLSLQQNNLSGEIPDEISQLQILVKLNISWNALNGIIPPSFSKLQKLSNLDLRVNNLSGRIPDSFGTIDSLLELQLGRNRLTGVGSLPAKLQIALNLSHNNFEGPIPPDLSKLQALEILDLSNNKFSGQIPSFFTRMSSLTQILFSNNRLTGTIPRFGSNIIVSTDGNNLSHPTPDTFVSMAKDKKPVSWAIVVASTSAVVVLTVVAIVALIYSRKVHKVNDEERDSSRLQVITRSNLLTGNVIHRSNLDFNKAMEAVAYPSNIFLKTRFSTYYKAVMPSGMTYFVKKLNWSDKIIQLGSHDLLEEELQVLGKLSNSSVMTPLAYALTSDSAYLFYEFTKKGSLFDVLHGNSGGGLDWTNRYSIAIGVANGLTFLHGCSSGPIILLDLSSKVVLLKSLNEPQIGDIELFKVIDPTKSTGNLSAVAGSVGYVPPEYAYTMRVTTAGNVYSFGVVLLELLTGKAAVSEGSELAKWVSSKSKHQDDYDQILDSTVSSTSPAIRDQMLAVLRVALACVNVSPDARPKMRSVLRMLLNARN
ncbi:hypothetical protein OSB04_005432 [Centaurea solstitialis]|uniref:Protein kinase domain-containing protein n=1 Tax=Centaurea solstitialis TaxID=347529 RepID=A0AA38WGG3_9ASTR|nr:hypothetical protein OSB04_005432 [Centaurea solstitialis]